ncbi:unnamed protein product [Phytomonas sp. Hart1]|nr:unnamed protein product [Phytomonas sp. Hart1]|eukprot:CCW67972.1 unnamed protein product [Phytomonas sp. isolate Hart1]
MSEFEVDVGLLTITDTLVVSGPMRREEHLMESCKKALKILLGEFETLPVVSKKSKFGGVVKLVELPQTVMRLPREKAPPKPKPLTAWQKFALKKGIDIHRKVPNRVFDEDKQKWKDKWGKRAREDKEKHDWLREVKPGYMPSEEGGDPFLDDRRAKQTRLETQKKKEEHNKRRSELIANAQKEVKHLEAAARHLTTASNNKFDSGKPLRKKNKMPK